MGLIRHTPASGSSLRYACDDLKDGFAHFDHTTVCRLQIADCGLPEPAVDSAPPNAPGATPSRLLLKADLWVWWLLLVGQCAPGATYLLLYYSTDRLMNVSSIQADPTTETKLPTPSGLEGLCCYSTT